jgi:RimJ/RimL family protein N-acetyltransferase
MIDKLSSKTIKLTLADECDAEFIFGLRTNESLNKHLSSISGDVNSQKKWLLDYKLREQKGLEYYFIIKRKVDDFKIGTVRLYDFNELSKSFCWGSWILTEGKTKSSAIESALLVYQFAFESLGFEQSHFDVRKENVKVRAFHEKIGSTKVSENDLDCFYVYLYSSYLELKEKYKNYL